MLTNTKNPAEMTGDERLQEVAAILARTISRTLENKQKERGLTGLHSLSKRSCDERKSSHRKQIRKVK